MSTIFERSLLLPSAQRSGRRWWIASLICLAVALLSAGFALGHFGVPGAAKSKGGAPAEHASQFSIFWEAWDHIDRQFYALAPLDSQAMTHGAIAGMVASLGDPFTSFAEPSRHRLESDIFQGDFGGIGASLALVDGRLTFIEVYFSSPAEVSGLQAGDRLLAVDGTEVTGLSLDQVVLLIRGPLEAPVRLEVQRGTEGHLSLSLVRTRIELPSLDFQLVSAGIGYVGIHLFTARTGDELARAIQSLREQNVSALVLDLRGSGGGLTGGAIEVLRHLVGHGIAFRELRRGGDEQRHAIPFGAPPVNWPVAVLVDGGTASAAEIVAAALHDYQRGVLIGERTFGKGSVQGVYVLSDGSSVHVTTSHWLSPSGYPIDGVGLEPDIVVPSVDVVQGKDSFLHHAVDYLERRTGRDPTGSVIPLKLHDSGKVMV